MPDALTPAARARAEHIMGLAASVFRVDSVLVWLADGDRVFVRPGCNAFPMGSRSACCHLLVPDAHVLAVDDTRAEPRCASVTLGRVPRQPGAGSEVRGRCVSLRTGAACLQERVRSLRIPAARQSTIHRKIYPTPAYPTLQGPPRAASAEPSSRGPARTCGRRG